MQAEPDCAHLESVLSSHLDAALRVPSFGYFPLTVIARVLTQRDRVLRDHHLLHRFVLAQFERFGEEAAVLIPAIDIAMLSEQEVVELLDQPAVRAASPVFAVSAAFRDEAGELRKQLAESTAVMREILARMSQLEDSNRQILAAVHSKPRKGQHDR